MPRPGNQLHASDTQAPIIAEYTSLVRDPCFCCQTSGLLGGSVGGQAVQISCHGCLLKDVAVVGASGAFEAPWNLAQEAAGFVMSTARPNPFLRGPSRHY